MFTNPLPSSWNSELKNTRKNHSSTVDEGKKKIKTIMEMTRWAPVSLKKRRTTWTSKVESGYSLETQTVRLEIKEEVHEKKGMR